MCGHSQSDKPHDAAAYTFARMAADVLAVLDDLGIAQAHVWGYSMGGAIVLRVARLAPERMRSIIVGGATPLAVPEEEVAWFEATARGLRDGVDAYLAARECESGPLPDSVRDLFLGDDGIAHAERFDGYQSMHFGGPSTYCGHGLGVTSDEPPALFTGDRTILRPGMFLTPEPGLYRHPRGGLRLEDNILIMEMGCDNLNTSRRWWWSED